MEQLLRSTTAYKLLAREAKEDRLANTCLLLFRDEDNLRAALKVFAALFFDGSERTGARIGRESHPDCLFFPAPGKAPDKDMAEAVVEESFLSPVEGKRKLFVLDNMHRANAVAQNKLLKILEEPPAGVYFLLGAASEFPLLPTVRSRAERLDVPPFSESQLTAFLERTYPGCKDAAACAAAADGVPGRAQRLLQGGRYAELSALAFGCVSASAGEIPAAARALNGVSEKNEFIAIVRRMYRDMLFFRTGQPYVTQGAEGARLRSLSETFPPALLVFALETFAAAEKQLTFNANLSQCTEVALWKIDKEKRKCNKS